MIFNQLGRAVSMEKHHLMIGVSRFDGVHSADNSGGGDHRG